jgi:nucleotide-binding universal stress UspA family protein
MSTAPIVVGTDGSATATRAVERAGTIASALGAPLHVVMCCESHNNAAWMAAAGGMAMTVDGGEQDRADAERVVSRARQALAQAGVEASGHVCTGDPAEALLAVAEGEHAQMIVVGNRGMTGARRVLWSVPNSVSHRARCAVLIVPTGGD